MRCGWRRIPLRLPFPTVFCFDAPCAVGRLLVSVSGGPLIPEPSNLLLPLPGNLIRNRFLYGTCAIVYRWRPRRARRYKRARKHHLQTIKNSRWSQDTTRMTGRQLATQLATSTEHTPPEPQSAAAPTRSRRAPGRGCVKRLRRPHPLPPNRLRRTDCLPRHCRQHRLHPLPVSSSPAQPRQLSWQNGSPACHPARSVAVEVRTTAGGRPSRGCRPPRPWPTSLADSRSPAP